VGDTVEVLLRLDSDESVELPGEAVYHLRYDWRRLQLLGVSGPFGLSAPILDRERGTAYFTQAAGAIAGDIRLRFRLLVGEGDGATIHLDSVMIASGTLVGRVCADSARVFITNGCFVTGVFLGKYRNLLGQAYPNPAQEWVEITYQQLEDARTVLQVFDAGGREVLRPLDGIMPGGRYTVRFSVAALPSGSYFYSLQAGSYSEARQMMVNR
jgi:hypothetical protein